VHRHDFRQAAQAHAEIYAHALRRERGAHRIKARIGVGFDGGRNAKVGEAAELFHVFRRNGRDQRLALRSARVQRLR
jgi:hypothetical protein